MQFHTNCEVATSMIARHKKPRQDLIVVLHSKSCDAAEKVVARLLKTRDRRGGDSTVIVFMLSVMIMVANDHVDARKITACFNTDIK